MNELTEHTQPPGRGFQNQPYVLLAAAVICLAGVFFLFWTMLTHQQEHAATPVSMDVRIADAFLTPPEISLLPASQEPEKIVYQLKDRDLVAPRPSSENYGEASEPAQLDWLLEQAKAQLSLDTPLFTIDTPVKEGSPIYYYFDETIYAVTWKQVLSNSTYTFSEVKIAHPSQLRRFLSDGQFGSGVLRTTTEMAQTVNAVVASSGDYYGYRSIGIVVNDGQVYRDRGHYLDTCYIDDNGDLIFTYAGQITDQEAAQKFVDDHNIRFSLSFGPVMLLNGEYCVPELYNSGEINTDYARAAICQMGPLHYVLVTANSEEPNYSVPTVAAFARNLQQQGIPKAYALDGGQTAAIAMNGKLINTVSYGAQRQISDIVYFATALPDP